MSPRASCRESGNLGAGVVLEFQTAQKFAEVASKRNERLQIAVDRQCLTMIDSAAAWGRGVIHIATSRNQSPGNHDRFRSESVMFLTVSDMYPATTCNTVQLRLDGCVHRIVS